MKQGDTKWLAVGFGVSFLVVGLPYWTMPYGSVSLPDTLVNAGLLVLVAVAVVLRLRDVASFWRVTGSVGTSVPAVVSLRVALEVSQDPTSHNLWPFELVIALFLGFSCAAVGALVGYLGSMLFVRRPSA